MKRPARIVRAVGGRACFSNRNSRNLTPMEPSPKIPPEKPWAILGISRRQYETAKPWKKARMSKGAFGKLLCMVPPEAIKKLKDVADAERLIEAAFGKGSCHEGE